MTRFYATARVMPNRGSASDELCAKQTATRPQNGRHLQDPPQISRNGFVAAFPSRVFRDGKGIFAINAELRKEFSWRVTSALAVGTHRNRPARGTRRRRR